MVLVDFYVILTVVWNLRCLEIIIFLLFIVVLLHFLINVVNVLLVELSYILIPKLDIMLIHLSSLPLHAQAWISEPKRIDLGNQTSPLLNAHLDLVPTGKAQFWKKVTITSPNRYFFSSTILVHVVYDIGKDLFCFNHLVRYISGRLDQL